MPDPNAALPQRYLRTAEAARFLGLSPRTLEKHRIYGTGPAYRKIGARVVYSVADLNAWAERGTRISTSDPGVGTVSIGADYLDANEPVVKEQLQKAGVRLARILDVAFGN